MKKFKKGFTLIELLIVIALLGALAVGLLAALDPFEQLKKGDDTGVRNTAAELHGAVTRYYGIKNQMPWCDNADCTAFTDTLSSELLPNTPGKLGTALTGMIDNIVQTGELKTNFTALAGGQLAKITVFGSNTTASIEVCYKPTAKSFIADPNTKFVAATGVEAAASTCVGQGGTDITCLWCLN